MKRYKVIKVVFVMMLVLMLGSISQISNAAVLQANPTTNSSPLAKGADLWITEIRNEGSFSMLLQ